MNWDNNKYQYAVKVKFNSKKIPRYCAVDFESLTWLNNQKSIILPNKPQISSKKKKKNLY